MNTYDADSYGSKRLDKSIYQDDSRLFHRADCAYSTVSAVKGFSSDAGIIRCGVELSDGTAANLTVSGYAPCILRLTLSRKAIAARLLEKSPMVVLPPAKSRLTARRQKGWIEIASPRDGVQLRLRAKEFRLDLWRHGNPLMVLEDERVAGKHITPPLGFRQCEGKEQGFLSWHIGNRDRFFGLGEKWNKVEKTSTRATIWACDTCGTNSNDMSYKSLPLLYCDAGWGLMLNSSFRSFWEVGNFSYTSGSMLVEEPVVDVFLFVADDVKGLIERYTCLTGRPSVPPRWSFGIWMSRCMYESRTQVESVVERMRSEKIPFDVIHLDPFWMKTHYYFKIGVDACDFVRNEAHFPNLSSLYADNARKGIATCLWVNPYLPEGGATYEEAAGKGYILKEASGGFARLEHGEPVGIVDFTNPAAKKWWKGKLIKELKAGAAVVKPDYGDRIPEYAVGFDGRSGYELHNIYLHLYAETCFEAVKEVYGEGLVWRRAGYIGSQRYPVTWAGDTQVSWEGLRNSMRGGLSAGFGGEAFWASDIGGFCGPKPDPELYIRWMQFGMFSSMCRFHGTTPREPWEYGPEALANTRHYAELRYRLVPYLLSLANEAARTGVPLMRHMAMEHPNEPNIQTLDDQYMLGDRLLVAPVVNPGVTQRSVYFPEGSWVGLEDRRESYDGPGFRNVPAPLLRIPVFVRKGAKLPVFAVAPQHLKGKLPAIVEKAT